MPPVFSFDTPPLVTKSKSPLALLFVGHPNSGKTTLFNQFTGSHFKTMNYPGSTVTYTTSTWKTATTSVMVMDTPGILSLSPHSEDEAVTIDTLTTLHLLIPGHTPHPDGLVVVIDASQPLRQLGLLHQLLATGLPVVVALTMIDVAQKRGLLIDWKGFQDKIDAPVVPINGRSGEGVQLLKDVCMFTLLQKKSMPTPSIPPIFSQAQRTLQFGWADDMSQAFFISKSPSKKTFDLDRIVLDPIWGWILFLGIMGCLFWSIFWLTAPCMDGIAAGFDYVGHLFTLICPPSWGRRLLVEGLLPGLSAVAVFVPQIACLFFLLNLLESSGYLARGATLVDRPLSRIGLNGKSFVPLLSGFACAIPAMMATRTITGKKERLLTLAVIPLMTCSARLPVYGLLLSNLVGKSHPFLAGLGMGLLYMGSIACASLMALVGGKLLQLPKSNLGFQIELPTWHCPVWRHVFVQVWHQTLGFIKKAGPIIVVISLILWVLSSYPTPASSLTMRWGPYLSPIVAPLGVDWRVGVALFLSFSAREVFVSALLLMGVKGTMIGTSSCVGLLVFFMISMQCLATLAIAKKETGSWRLPLIVSLFYSILAYILAIGVVQFLHILGVS